MKRLLIGVVTAAALAGVGTAIAADVAPYYRAPPVVVPVFSWTGFYVGGNVGGAWSSNNALWSPLPSSAAFGAFPAAGNTGGSSAIGGFQAGYNWQFRPHLGRRHRRRLVLGQRRQQLQSAMGSQSWRRNGAGLLHQHEFHLDWVSSLRARLGYLVLPKPDGLWHGRRGLGKVDYAASNLRRAHRGTPRAPHSPAPKGVGWLVAASNG